MANNDAKSDLEYDDLLPCVKLVAMQTNNVNFIGRIIFKKRYETANWFEPWSQWSLR